MAKITNCSIDRLTSGAYRARKMYKGNTITCVGEIGETEAEVRKKFDKLFEDTIKNGTVNENWKVGRWIDYWLENYKKPLDLDKERLRKKTKGGRVNANTFSRMLTTYDNQLKKTKYGKLLLRKQLNSVKPEDIQLLINELEKQGLADSTVKKAQVLLSEAFKEAVKNKYMTSNPAMYVNRNGLVKQNEDEEVYALSATEVGAFIKEALKTDEYGMPIYQYGAGVALQLMCGCRSGELRALEWDNVGDDCIHIRHSVSWVKNLDENDKSGKKTKVYLSNTKSASSRREIPYDKGSVIDECVQILKKRCQHIPNKNNLVMPTSRGGYLTPNNYNKEIGRIIDNISCEIFTSHSLRHTFIALLVNDENRDLATIASLVGHGDLRVTLKYANHTNREKKQQTLQAISDLVSL